MLFVEESLDEDEFDVVIRLSGDLVAVEEESEEEESLVVSVSVDEGDTGVKLASATGLDGANAGQSPSFFRSPYALEINRQSPTGPYSL